MKNALFISSVIRSKTGGRVVSSSILKALLCIFGNHLYTYELPSYTHRLDKLLGYLSLNSRPLSSTDYNAILELISNKNIEYIFLNGSLYGKLVRLLKKNRLDIKIITFYHNVESVFVKDILIREYKISHLLAYIAALSSERIVTKFTDLKIGLNKRDSQNLFSIYNKEMDIILPLSIEDRFDDSSAIKDVSGNSKGLFVGSDFYANYYGLKWFIENVSPYINATITVVGNGMEKYQKQFERYKNINIIGTVDSLSQYYYDADFVISPIFDGSGMKTKTAEALMYGKTIIGTTEAFEGYLFNSNIGFVCNDKNSFIDTINNNSFMRFNKDSRSLYLSNYSFECMLKTLKFQIESL